MLSFVGKKKTGGNTDRDGGRVAKGGKLNGGGGGGPLSGLGPGG